jgi:transposase
MVEQIFYVLGLAEAWRELPACYGQLNSVYSRRRSYCQLVLWKEILRLKPGRPQAECLL